MAVPLSKVFCLGAPASYATTLKLVGDVGVCGEDVTATRLLLVPAIALLKQGELANYYLAHSARAELYRRLGRTAEARASYERALALTQQEPERQFLQKRIRQLK
jgi:predicted RNA polymerase sigma factor